MEHLTVEDLLSIAEEVLGVPAVRDIGLLDAAARVNSSTTWATMASRSLATRRDHLRTLA
jgi:hypothetical protein